MRAASLVVAAVIGWGGGFVLGLLLAAALPFGLPFGLLIGATLPLAGLFVALAAEEALWRRRAEDGIASRSAAMRAGERACGLRVPLGPADVHCGKLGGHDGHCRGYSVSQATWHVWRGPRDPREPAGRRP